MNCTVTRNVQTAYGRTQKYEDVENDLRQKYNENLGSYEINDKAEHLYKTQTEGKKDRKIR